MALRTKDSEMATCCNYHYTYNYGCSYGQVKDRLVEYAKRLAISDLSKKEEHLLKALIQECLRQMKPEKKQRKKKK